MQSQFSFSCLYNSIKYVDSSFIWCKISLFKGKRNRDVYAKPPQEAELLKLWKLKTIVYGLCDTPWEWYLSVKGVPSKTSAVKIKFDDSVFYWQKDRKLEELISCHVDDLFWGGTRIFEICVIINTLKRPFKKTSQGELKSSNMWVQILSKDWDYLTN